MPTNSFCRLPLTTKLNYTQSPILFCDAPVLVCFCGWDAILAILEMLWYGNHFMAKTRSKRAKSPHSASQNIKTSFFSILHTGIFIISKESFVIADPFEWLFNGSSARTCRLFECETSNIGLLSFMQCEKVTWTLHPNCNWKTTSYICVIYRKIWKWKVNEMKEKQYKSSNQKMCFLLKLF